MSRFNLSSGFTLIPEGTYVFYIYDCTYDEDFGRMLIKMITAQGLRYQERFTLKDENDQISEKAMNAFSYFAKTALNNFGLESIDNKDLIGHYIRAEVLHTSTPSKKDPSKTLTFANLGQKSPADGFDTVPVASVAQMIGGNAPAAPSKPPMSASDIDLDKLLG